MRNKLPKYGERLPLGSKETRVSIRYVLPLDASSACIGSALEMDWGVFMNMVDGYSEDTGKALIHGPVEAMYQGIIIHEILGFYKAGVHMPTKLTCRDTLVARDESLMLKIRIANNYSFSVNLIK